MATVTATISAQQSYYGSSTSSDFVGAVGMPDGYYAAYSMRFKFTVSKPCTSLSIALKPSQNYSAGYFDWKITTSTTFPTSGLTAKYWGSAGATTTITSSGTYNAGTTYYLWILGRTTYYGYVTGITRTRTTITGTVRNYTVTSANGTGYSWSATSTSVPYGSSTTLTLTIASGYQKGSNFAVTASAGTLTDNGDGTYTISNVTSAITITVTGVEEAPSGLVRICNGSSFTTGQVYIYNGTTWVKAIPYVYTGSAWKICS